MLGTPGYMSPEQVRGLPLDARTDVFSFGVVLYELLSGKHPFRRETPMATLSAILEETPPELSVTARHVSPQVAAIVVRCWRSRGRSALLRARPCGGTGGCHGGCLRAGGRGGGNRGAEPVPRVVELHREGRGTLLRAGGGGQGALAASAKPQVTCRHRSVGDGQDVVCPRRCHPGRSGRMALPVGHAGKPAICAVARSLVPELSNDPETLQRLVGAETGEELTAALGVWRRRQGEALVVVDQFEELFTLNPKEVQERFAALLGRLTSEADVHVLISLRTTS